MRQNTLANGDMALRTQKRRRRRPGMLCCCVILPASLRCNAKSKSRSAEEGRPACMVCVKTGFNAAERPSHGHWHAIMPAALATAWAGGGRCLVPHSLPHIGCIHLL